MDEEGQNHAPEAEPAQRPAGGGGLGQADLLGQPERFVAGFATAADIILAGGPGAGNGPEQLDLDLVGLPPIRDDRGNNVVPMPRRGRMAGVRNRRTEEWIQYFFDELGYTSPVQILLQMGQMGIEELSKSLRCSPLEAANLKIKCLEATAPFLHPKLAAVEVKAAGDPTGSTPSRLQILDVTPLSEREPA